MGLKKPTPPLTLTTTTTTTTTTINTLLLLTLLLLLLLFTTPTKSQSQPFECKTNATCQSLIDYVSPNTTTLSSIKTLFSIKNLRTILGANNYPLTTLPNTTVREKQVVRIPFRCACGNGTGKSDNKPVYTVQPGDGLDHIAREVFSGLVTYQEIAAVNGIENVDLINSGQRLRIPLPCSCDDVAAGEKVVHYGHVVESGSSLDGMAAEYGTTKEVIMGLNQGVNDSTLQAGQVLDIPLKACNSSVNSTSLDYPLLVANGTYFFTANNCVRCTCNAANNWTLQCEPSGLNSSNWATCPSMSCGGADNLSLSNSITSGCTKSSCAYAGYTKETVLTSLIVESTCPVVSPDNYASRMDSSWNIVLLVLLHLLLFSLYLV